LEKFVEVGKEEKNLQIQLLVVLERLAEVSDILEARNSLGDSRNGLEIDQKSTRIRN
jgi:hypothetical protein